VTQRFQLLGDPVGHSISPEIHAAAFQAWGLDATYTAVRVSALGLEAAVGHERLRGGNITVPHKLRAAALVDEASPEVRATGACNCFWRDDGVLHGTNTDVGGFIRALEGLGVDVEGTRVLLLGAGGAARAAAHALTGLGVGALDIRNRTLSRGRLLAQRLGPEVSTQTGPPTGRYDLIVNATRLGLDPEDGWPIDLRAVDCAVVFDMVYAAGGTAWVRHARALGLPAQDGLPMLVHQAALSLRSWFPDRTPPLANMLYAAEAALETRAAAWAPEMPAL